MNEIQIVISFLLICISVTFGLIKSIKTKQNPTLSIPVKNKSTPAYDTINAIGKITPELQELSAKITKSVLSSHRNLKCECGCGRGGPWKPDWPVHSGPAIDPELIRISNKRIKNGVELWKSKMDEPWVYGQDLLSSRNKLMYQLILGGFVYPWPGVKYLRSGELINHNWIKLK